jgi:hypothetical protein
MFRIQDPEKNLFRIPDPWGKKAPDPGSGSAKLSIAYPEYFRPEMDPTLYSIRIRIITYKILFSPKGFKTKF